MSGKQLGSDPGYSTAVRQSINKLGAEGLTGTSDASERRRETERIDGDSPASCQQSSLVSPPSEKIPNKLTMLEDD